MKLKDLNKEEISAMSYDDLAYLILEEKGKKMKISDLFQRVCTLMELDERVFENKIADFFELLSTDKKFIMLDDGSWDIRDKHTTKIKIETDDEDILIESTEDFEEITDLTDDDEEEENIFFESEETDDEAENDLKDLVVIDDEEEPSSL